MCPVEKLSETEPGRSGVMPKAADPCNVERAGKRVKAGGKVRFVAGLGWDDVGEGTREARRTSGPGARWP